MGHKKWSRLSVSEIQVLVNQCGKKCLSPYKFVSLLTRPSRVSKIKISRTDCKSVLISTFASLVIEKRNPWKRKIILFDAKRKINFLGSKANPKFKMIKLLRTKKSSLYLVELLNLETGERLFRNYDYFFSQPKYNPWSKLWTDKEIKEIVNNFGNNIFPKYKFFRVLKKKSHNGERWVEVMAVLTKEKKKCYFSNLKRGMNPFAQRHNRIPNKKIKKIINSIGSKSDPKFKFIREVGQTKENLRLIEIQNLETKAKAIRPLSKLKNGNRNPWASITSKYRGKYLSSFVNKIGRKSSPKYKFVKDVSSKKERRITIQNCATKECRSVLLSYFTQGSNPWTEKGYNRVQTRIKVNKVGKSSSPPFRFIDLLEKRGKRGAKMIKIENLKTKEKMDFPFGYLLRGSNPWNTKSYPLELREIHPLIKKGLSDLDIKIESEVTLIKSRVDMVITFKSGLKALVEIKCDRDDGIYWQKSALENQIYKYHQEGIQKYGKYYLKTFLISPNGNQKLCISLEKFREEISSYL